MSTLKGVLPDVRQILSEEIEADQMQELKEISMHFEHTWCSEWHLQAAQKVPGIKSSETNVIFAVDQRASLDWGVDEITEVTFDKRGLKHGSTLAGN